MRLNDIWYSLYRIGIGLKGYPMVFIRMFNMNFIS